MFRLFRSEVNKIVEITKENAELNRGVGDATMMFIRYKKGEKHISLKNGNTSMSLVLRDILDLMDENKELQKRLNDNGIF